MADDEVLLHVQSCIKLSGRNGVRLLDPVLALGWLRVGAAGPVQSWLMSVPSFECIVALVPLHEHWIPVFWTRNSSHVSVSV